MIIPSLATGVVIVDPRPDAAPCCVCPQPDCQTDDTGDTCVDASCAVCLHGCPAGLSRPCCRDLPDDDGPLEPPPHARSAFTHRTTTPSGDHHP